jgi:chromosome segregation ATPase
METLQNNADQLHTRISHLERDIRSLRDTTKNLNQDFSIMRREIERLENKTLRSPRGIMNT